MVDSPNTNSTKKQITFDSKVPPSLSNVLPELTTVMKKNVAIQSIEVEASRDATTFALTTKLEENTYDGQKTLTDWALCEDPSHLYWVPAHLHPEIDPLQFSTWLQKHSSAVNYTETPLTRRKSILSLHSYGGSEFTNKFMTAGELKTSTPALTSSKLSRQITELDGMKSPRTKDESGLAPPVSSTPYRIQSRNLHSSLKRSARTKVRRNSVKSIGSSMSTRTCDSQRMDTPIQNEENGVEQTNSLGEHDSSEIMPQDSDTEILTKDFPHERKEVEQSNESLDSQYPPPRSDSLPNDISSDISVTKEPEVTEEPAYTNSKNKSYSWSRFWASEPNEARTKTAKSKKIEKSRTSREMSPRVDSSQAEKEDTKSKISDDPLNKPNNSGPKSISSNKKFTPPVSAHKTKKSYSPIFTLFTKSKNKSQGEIKGSNCEINPTTMEQSAEPVYCTDPRRLPIYIERGIYRLSHIKLANPRRPLLQQVLISNMLYWYISIINQESFNPAFTEDSSTGESVPIIGKPGKAMNGRRRVKRYVSNPPDGPNNGKRSEFVVKSPQYSRQQLRIHNGNMAIMPVTPSDAVHQQLLANRSSYSNNSPYSYTKYKGEDESGTQEGGDDDDELPLAIYKVSLDGVSS